MSTSTKLAQFHLGMSEDGTQCLMVFVDENQNSMECTADQTEFVAFINSLVEAAKEMAKRTGSNAQPESPTTVSVRPVEVTSAAFSPYPGDESIMGALVAEDGTVVGVRMNQTVAGQIARDLVLALPGPNRKKN